MLFRQCKLSLLEKIKFDKRYHPGVVYNVMHTEYDNYGR